MKKPDHTLSQALSSLLGSSLVPLEPQEPVWLQEEREVCRQLLLTNGLPGRGREAWRYTDVAPVNRINWVLPAPTSPASGAPCDKTLAADLNLVCHNGYFLPPDQHGLTGLDVAIVGITGNYNRIHPVLSRTNFRMESPFTVLNRALWPTAACIQIPPESTLSIHVQLLYGDEEIPLLSAPRLHVKLGHHSNVDLSVTHASSGSAPSLGTANIDIDLGTGARLTYLHEQALHPEAMQFTTTRINLARDASLHALDVAMGSSLSRHELTSSLQESGADAILNGIYLLNGKQTTDFHTVIEHRQPNARSRQVYKGVLDDQAHAIFNGLVEVHPGASGTDGYQMNRTLLRSKKAVIDTKPELQIHNDDVKCSHGATIGQIDPLELFYLHSRGIAPDEARAILARAFVADIIHQHPSEPQRKHMSALVTRFFQT